ncbi:hypothetical protein FJZ40_02530 [Candidatus Shapirobacteria bacterium]|nr:hypothetical protein [Candidatus Shapirobacteria bacterium]
MHSEIVKLIESGYFNKIGLMCNWSTDEAHFKKHDPEGFRVWQLLQLINYGLDGEKLDKKELLKYWPRIKGRIFDKATQKCLEMLLWPKAS